MKLKPFVFVLIFICQKIKAQEITTSLSYNYMYSHQLDKLIQTNNFSKPYLANKQPLFINGIHFDLSYTFKNEKKIKHGINSYYSYFSSTSKNENLINRFNLHFASLNYLINYSSFEKYKKFYLDATIGIIASGLNRNVNSSIYLIDEEKLNSFGIGANIGLKLGIKLIDKERFILSPYINFGYSPYLFSPKNEEVINGTKNLISSNWNSVIFSRIGIQFHLKSK